MAKKRGPADILDPKILDQSAVIDVGFGEETISVRDIVAGDRGKNMDRADKAALVLRITGMKGKKKKYESKEAQKAAQQKRDKERREKERAELEKVGLAPKKRGPKRTAAEDKAYRTNYAANAYRERVNSEQNMVKNDYKLAVKYLGAKKAERVKDRMIKGGLW